MRLARGFAQADKLAGGIPAIEEVSGKFEDEAQSSFSGRITLVGWPSVVGDDYRVGLFLEFVGRPSAEHCAGCMWKCYELAEAVGIELGGTFSKIMDNLKESGITREYPRYGKARVETVYQLKDFFSLFYLHFIYGKGVDRGNWRAVQRTPSFYAWAGNTFEMLCIEHMAQMKDALRITTITKNYCWRGPEPDGSEPQVDLVLEWKGERTDYLCEMKFSEHVFTIDKKYELELASKIEAFRQSKQHTKTHSIQLVMVTTSGTTHNEHAKDVNQQVTLDNLFGLV